MLNELELTGRARSHVIQRDDLGAALHRDALEAWLAMKTAAARAGLELEIVSAFRDFGAQQRIWDTKFRGERPLYDAQGNVRDHAALTPAERVDAIVMAACDENALIDVINQAMDAGITVITIDSGVKSDRPLSFVATDNVAAAHMAADKLAELIGGKGEVGVIPIVPGAATSEMREQGFREGVAKYPDIESVSVLHCDSDAAKAMSVTEDMMTAHPDLVGIFAESEPGAVGATHCSGGWWSSR